MVLSFEQAGELLDRMAEEFPPEFYDELNGGICLLPEAKHDPEFPEGELYIMGEYRNSGMMESSSICTMAPSPPWPSRRTGGRRTGRRSFTARWPMNSPPHGGPGRRTGLEIQDEAFLEQYRREEHKTEKTAFGRYSAEGGSSSLRCSRAYEMHWFASLLKDTPVFSLNSISRSKSSGFIRIVRLIDVIFSGVLLIRNSSM
jgi:hypothetical protein